MLLDAVRRLHEQNPMLGLRGVRLGLVIPGLFDMQVRAIAHAAAELKQAGKDPHPEVMIPLTASVQEMEITRERDREGPQPRSRRRPAPHVHTLIGTMIEVPRAAMIAGEIAKSAEFFSFGTNDLTQMTWGFSRDDVEGAFFSRYIELGIFGVSPFETIDRDGVGRLVDIAVRRGPGRPGPTWSSASAASTAATRTRSTSSTRWAWTTCPARRSACRSPGWRRAARRSPRGAATAGERVRAGLRRMRHGPLGGRATQAGRAQ